MRGTQSEIAQVVAVPHTPTLTLLRWIAMDLIDNEWENFNRLQSGFMTPPPHEPEKLTELARSGFKRPSPDSPEAPLVSAGCAAPELAIDGPGATLGSDDGVGRGPTGVRKEICAAEVRAAKLARRTGAIVAPSRCQEGFKLPSGNQRTCLPDAAFAGLCALNGADFKAVSLARLRSLSVPTLGDSAAIAVYWSEGVRSNILTISL